MMLGENLRMVSKVNMRGGMKVLDQALQRADTGEALPRRA